MEITGIITHKSEVTKVGKKELPKISITVTETKEKEEYKNNSLNISFLGDSVEKIKDIIEDDEVTVYFNTKTTEYNGKIYNNVNGWNIKLHEIKDEDTPF